MRNKRKPHGFYSKLDCEDVIKYAIDNYFGKTLTEILKNKESGFYRQINKLNLKDTLYGYGILVDPYKFSKMDCDQIIQYTCDNYFGKMMSEIGGTIAKRIRLLNLQNFLWDEGILKKSIRKSLNFYSKMDSDDVIKYARDNYYGKQLSNIIEKDSRFYDKIRKLNLQDLLFEKGILINPNQYFKMNHNDVIKYVHENYFGKTLFEIKKKEGRLYFKIRKLNLQDLLFEEGILKNPHPYFKMNRNNVIKYVRDNYFGKTLNYILKNKGSGLHKRIKKLNLLDTLCDEGILIQIRKSKGKKNNKKNVLDRVNNESNYFSIDLPEEFMKKKKVYNNKKVKKPKSESKKKLGEKTSINFSKGNFFEQLVGLTLKYIYSDELVIPQYCLNVYVNNKNGEGFFGTRADFKVGNEIYEVKVGSQYSKNNIRNSIENQTKYLRKSDYSHNLITLDDYVLEDDLKNKTSQIGFFDLVEGNARLIKIAQKMNQNEISVDDYLLMTNYANKMLMKATNIKNKKKKKQN